MFFFLHRSRKGHVMSSYKMSKNQNTCYFPNQMSLHIYFFLNIHLFNAKYCDGKKMEKQTTKLVFLLSHILLYPNQVTFLYTFGILLTLSFSQNRMVILMAI